MAETKLYLNIQEQVEKNKNDIKFMLEEEGTLNKFGIKVIGQEDDVSDMPSVADYKEEHEDWAYGDAYAIGTEAPYTLYILTRANGTHPNDYWFNIGQFPVPGPQGEAGPAGEDGVTPNVQAYAIASGLAAGSSPTANVSRSGPDSSPLFNFFFGIPKGDKGDTGAKGDPGAFAINGQVANASLLPDASLVDADTAYAVGTVLPYDIYVIMTVGGVQSWLNLGPIINEISDTYSISDTWHSSGTLSEEQLNALVNDGNMNFLKIGNYFFVKNIFVESPGFMLYTSFYPISMNATGKANVIYLIINTSSGAYETDTKELVDVSSAQTITGEKTFNSVIKQNGGIMLNSGSDFDIKNSSGNPIYRFTEAMFRPMSDNSRDIGFESLRFKNAYFSGQVYAQNTFNVINASDIVNSTLTQDQYDLITNGKPTFIMGELSSVGRTNILMISGGGGSNKTFIGFSNYQIESYNISQNTRVISRNASGTRSILIQSIGTFNGKVVPAYPATTGTFVLKCVDGVLTWVAE